MSTFCAVSRNASPILKLLTASMIRPKALHESGCGPLLTYAAKAERSAFKGRADHHLTDAQDRVLTRSGHLGPERLTLLYSPKIV
jgi:hypothetical protein